MRPSRAPRAEPPGAGAGHAALMAALQHGRRDDAALATDRQLRRSLLSVENRLRSIDLDSRFVIRAQIALDGLPLVANLRNGRWYAPSFDATAYFKSTDGHAGHWGFSLSRLNLHVARLAAGAPGCLLVDSTRSGKLFPDALSKTVPIWCAVLNAALLGDASARFPPWVPESEVAAILERLPGWVASLAPQLDALCEALLPALRPPGLRCAWLAPGDELPAAVEPQTIVCLSASAPQPPGERTGFHYVQGAGDDEEHWAPPGLSPELFWRHKQELIASGGDVGGLPGSEEEEELAVRVGQSALWVARAAPPPAADLVVVAPTAGERRRRPWQTRELPEALRAIWAALSSSSSKRCVVVGGVEAEAVAVAALAALLGAGDGRLRLPPAVAAGRLGKAELRRAAALLQQEAGVGPPPRRLMQELSVYFSDQLRAGSSRWQDELDSPPAAAE